MFKRLVGFAVLAIGIATPAFAQDKAACQAGFTTFRQAAVVISQQSADVAGALAARAGLSEKESAARTACTPLGAGATIQIDMTKEDLDIALATYVPACKVFMDQARPHIAMLPKLKLVPREAETSIAALTQIRNSAGEACRDYPGVLGRMLRVENDLVFSLPQQSGGRSG